MQAAWLSAEKLSRPNSCQHCEAGAARPSVRLEGPQLLAASDLLRNTFSC